MRRGHGAWWWRRPITVVVAAIALLATLVAVTAPTSAEPRARPRLVVRSVASGLDVPWDLTFTPDGSMLFTERFGRLSIRRPNGVVAQVQAELGDLFVSGETGFMAIVADPDFSENRRFYTCQGHDGPQIQVIGWRLSADGRRATRVADPLVGGIDLASGRHGGCRLRFGPEGALWISTGDAAIGTTPQALDSLAGKVLRVDSRTGAGWPGNPFAGSANAKTRRIYTFGHRNPQGLAQRPGTAQMWAVEHGPNRDDEINRLRKGGNYGWNPVPGYNEGVPMTFAGGVPAAWSSGSPTLATSGATWLSGQHWGSHDGMLAVAALKAQELRLFRFDQQGNLTSQSLPRELDGRFGRLRTAQMGPDGNLYLTTANGGGNDHILRVRPVIDNDPIGTVGVLRVANNGDIKVGGRVHDPNRPFQAVRVVVRVDGVIRRVVPANLRLATPIPGAGRFHRFSTAIDAGPGPHVVCVRARNLGPGEDVRLACKRVVVPG